MRTRMNVFQRTLGWFLGTVVVVLLAVFVGAMLTSSSGPAADGAVVGACILLGLAWIVLGWIFAPSVETYLGPGASRGIPIMWPANAIPERNAEVLSDLKGKLSGQTDMGIVFAGLGFLLMVVGFLFYASATVGFLLLVGFLTSLALVLAYTLLPSDSGRVTEQTKAPPNP